MYRLRSSVFKDQLDWSMSVSGDLELDVYDTMKPTHLLVMLHAGEVVGCAEGRLRPIQNRTHVHQFLAARAVCTWGRSYCLVPRLWPEQVSDGLASP